MRQTKIIKINNWVDDELKDADLGDTRLKERLVTIVNSLSSKPTQSIPASCSTWSEIKASYLSVVLLYT